MAVKAAADKLVADLIAGKPEYTDAMAAIVGSITSDNVKQLKGIADRCTAIVSDIKTTQEQCVANLQNGLNGKLRSLLLWIMHLVRPPYDIASFPVPRNVS